MEPERSARSDLRIDRPLLPERPPSGRLVSGTLGQDSVDGHAGVRGDLRPGRECPADYATSVDTGGPCGSHRRHATRAGAAGRGSGTAAPQATAVLVPAWRAGHDRTQARGRPPCSAVPWPACPPWCPPQPATVSGCGQRTAAAVSGVQGAGRPCGHAALRCPPADPAAACECPRLQEAVALAAFAGGVQPPAPGPPELSASRSRSCSGT
jgi:hypothetical protein